MDEQDEKKLEKREKRKQWGENIFNIIRYAKYLSNPVVLYAVLIILIIILAIGAISYLLSMPGKILGRVAELFNNALGYDSLYIKDEEVLNLANYLEEMGYDLEAYGFVDTITRTGEKTYEDQEFENNKPTRGDVQKVSSKYLRAYIAAEKKMYLIANPERPWYQVLLRAIFPVGILEKRDYVFKCLETAADEVIEQKWPTGTPMPDEISKAFNKMYELDGDVYKLRSGVNFEEYNGNSSFFTSVLNYYGKMDKYREFPKDEKDTMVRSLLRSYLKFWSSKIEVFISQDPTHDPGITSELPDIGKTTVIETGAGWGEALGMFRFIAGLKFASYMDSTTEWIQLRDYYYYKIKNETDQGTGSIYLDNNEEEYSGGYNQEWRLEGEDTAKHHVEIDTEQRIFIVKTDVGGSGLWDSIKEALGFGSLSRYFYNLNGWTTKYGKPTEFLIAMHVATMAPDFAYKLATEGAVDTKVHVDLFPIQITISLHPAENDETSILGLIDDVKTDADIIKAYKELIIQKINGSGNLSTTCKTYKDFFDQETEEGEDEPSMDDYRAYLKRKLNALNNLDDIMAFAKKIFKSNVYEDIEKNEKLIEVKGVEGLKLSYYDLFGDGQIRDTIQEWENEVTSTAQPYITKVINHWFRNNYFTGIEDEDGEASKERAKDMVKLVYEYFYNPMTTSALADMNGYLAKIDAMTSLDELRTFVSTFRTTWLHNAESKDEVTKQKIQNELNAAYKQICGSNFSGGAYRINSNPAPLWYSLEEIGTKGGFDTSSVLGQFLSRLWIREQRDMDIYQIHNPLFEDNSRYIRTWLKDKYYIFDGTTDNSNVEEGSSETTGVALSDSKIAKGMEYINGMKALEKIDEELASCDVRSDMEYMLRDAKQLFEDFDFDLENQNIPEEKVLDNVMPDYKPYTNWPSLYEKSEANCTKMIYKTGGSHSIVAPADAVVDAVGSGFIQLKFEDRGATSTITEDMILRISTDTGSISSSVSEGDKVSRGQKIGTVSPGTIKLMDGSTSDSMVILKLHLFTAIKQLVKVENYMTVERKTYDNLVSSGEAAQLRSLLASEIYLNRSNGGLSKEELSTTRTAECIATTNTIFNKISSPYVKGASNISNVCSGAATFGFLLYKGDVALDENSDTAKAINNAIKNTLSGVDITKEHTVVGATGYYGGTKIDSAGNEEELYYTADMGDTQKFKDERDALRIKVQIGDRIFGVPEDEYKNYVGEMVNKKLDEIIYSLNVTKLVLGTQQIPGMDQSKVQEELLAIFEKFKDAKDKIVEYYLDGTFLTECGGITPSDLATVTSLMKIDLTDEFDDMLDGETSEEGEEGTREITNTFVLMANANYNVRWTWTYKIDKEGKMISNAEVDHKAIRNY